jgi:Domain of unknown function (DUF5063)
MSRGQPDPVVEFLETAQDFVALVDGVARWRRADRFMAEVYRLTANLLALALALPEPSIADDDFDNAEVIPEHNRPGPDQWRKKHDVLKRLLGDRNVFWEVFDPRTEEAPISGSLSDAIAEIWSHLKSGLEHIDDGRSLDGVVWAWRWTFWSIWGHHLTDVMRLVTSDFDDETWSARAPIR